MPSMARFIPLILSALLAACASSPPPPQVFPQAPFPVTTDARADDVLMSAIGLVGTPYRYGGNTPDGGFDCSGLIGHVYRNSAGIQLPRSTREMNALHAPNLSRNALQSGDLVFFATNGGGKVSHAGIYVGEGRFVHAPSSGGQVRLNYLSEAYWQKTYLGAKRVLAPTGLAQKP